ncbi:Uncharacterised protein [Porphyromonas macacae]|uniref:Uncharacterized protein n=1 Tax=Porphyromonas macacae TaxID=28115 RepID=A0A379EBJ8_9PORP|nr:Uncharacterised protein [Porphyromonas macacae]
MRNRYAFVCKNTENADGTLDKSLTTNAAEAQPITLDKYPDPKLTAVLSIR